MNTLREKYNGYRFGLSTADGKASEPIYNPFALNYVFKDLEFNDYWSLSGSASMLSAKLVAAEDHYSSLLRIPIDKLKKSYKPSDMTLPSLMYYAGYATIDSYDKSSEVVTLKVPNSTVEKDLAGNFLASVFSKTGLTAFEAIIGDICNLLNQTPIAVMQSKINDIEGKFNTLLSHYTYKSLKDEFSFQIIMDTIFKTRFARVDFEFRTLDGRADAAVFSDSRVFVLEYKYNKSSAKALQQIHQKQYYNAAAILGSKRSILLLGINLDVDVKGVKRVKIAYELHRDSSG
jgi:hypothetical protein